MSTMNTITTTNHHTDRENRSAPPLLTPPPPPYPPPPPRPPPHQHPTLPSSPSKATTLNPRPNHRTREKDARRRHLHHAQNPQDNRKSGLLPHRTQARNARRSARPVETRPGRPRRHLCGQRAPHSKRRRGDAVQSGGGGTDD